MKKDVINNKEIIKIILALHRKIFKYLKEKNSILIKQNTQQYLIKIVKLAKK